MAATTYVSKQAVTAQTRVMAHIRLGNLLRQIILWDVYIAAPGVVVRADNFVEVTLTSADVPINKLDQYGLELKV
jgi:hypothetical protein